MRYPELPSTLVALEEAVLERWRKEDTFRRTLQATADGEQFVFFEGPPTANGRPGLHHVISRAIKDLVCRYQTMLGKHVTRIAGWDTHGLPVEIEAQKQLGIEDKREIEERGIAWFNERCRESVLAYTDEWERFSERIGYWQDYSRPYVTFHAEYIESIWWIMSRMADRGLLYKGHKVVPWCPSDQTVLSSHELSLGYRDVKDPSLWVTLELLDGSGRHALVWTTTPWTLVSNAALAVHPEIEYVEVEDRGKRLVLASKRAEALFGGERIGATVPVSELIGARYRRPFEIIPADAVRGRAWEIVAADFVSDEEGSGVVHMSPAYGADDYQAGKDFGLAVMEPVQNDGTFAADLPLIGGLFFKDADAPLVRDLEERGLVFACTGETHSYPHCWRCDAPLVYMARHSWFARTSTLRDDLLANNAQVNWHPAQVGEGRFGEWLKGNVDWALSRDRYWGTPLPAWVSEDDPEHVVWIGSFAELAEKAGGLPDDFDPHRPFIDEITWRCPETGSVMRRTPEVIDVWFDSGAMPWAQWHYPFENREEYDRHFPADFICEAVDQTRGWFYSLHAISTMLGLGPAFRNVIVNDLILDAAGQKMSKSRGNVVNPWDAVADHGADGVRWYMITVSNPWLPTRFDPDGVRESAARFFDTLLNTYRFFALYANLEDWAPAAGHAPPASRSPLDRWLLSRLNRLIGTVRDELDAYNPTRAYRAVAAFVDGELSNWYVRRSRSRFWGNAESADSAAAFATLHDALRITALLVAPVTPFTSDWLHRALTGRSSHTEPFPEADAGLIDDRLEADMTHVRTLSTLGRAAREQIGVRVRQPLGRLLAVVPGTPPADDVLALLCAEINVKRVEFAASSEGLVKLAARPDFRALGRRFRRLTQKAAARIRALDAEALRTVRDGGTVRIEVNGAWHEVGADELEVVEEAQGDWIVRSEGRCTVGLDPAISDELRLEGLARELVNRIQRLRRDSGLAVSDRIRLGIGGSDAVRAAALAHGEVIARETLALAVDVTPGIGDGFDFRKEAALDGEAAILGLSVSA
ncbi:MAG: isoleucine--tRNA ligase [Gemmatimonadetes bacterium]|nr:isoleucine--tRNA ligase [Gemmatimonadota bacterium]MXX71697.1 isoleucine--tRNA ligase [Gemmatimonadota bacterium]MYC93245.1 isoleucine--tRNA ligase [Gemmatimonadota bacterium]MYG34693.1 isoleucine--tRNA ligase [Gemmatimonadota bacterium]MYJ16668.1 isoleucine--tRNA ligase [Gemmatimonadota bacterium]